MTQIVIGIAIPFIGTTLGAAMVFFLRNKMCRQMEELLPGLASGVMVAASVWSLLIPAAEMAEEQAVPPWLTVSLGFILGVVFLLFIDYVLQRMQKEGSLFTGEMPGNAGRNKKLAMMVLVITLHNLPEGMAVGVSFAGALMHAGGVTMAGAFALAVGIAIQNIPEGAIISLPVGSAGAGKLKAFGLGTLSGLVEPVGAVITLRLVGLVVPLLPYLLAFAAGAMLYVVVEELLPSLHQSVAVCEDGRGESVVGVVGFTVGFVLMMALDVALG